MKAALRFIFLAVFLLFFFLNFKSFSFAQNSTQMQSTNQTLNYETNPDVPRNLHTWTQNVLIEVMSALSCQLAGVDPITKDHKCLGIDPNTGKLGYVNNNGGLLGFTTNSIAYLYTPPTHATDYIRYLSSNFGVTKPSYAASEGFGFNSIAPLKDLWVAFRNIVYLAFVIVFLVIGIAIMFRVKIDPRTVMTVQNQIPKIIIGIILVTFSFAIAGLLIDLMYVASYLLLGIIFSAEKTATVTGPSNIINMVSATNPFNGLNAAVNGGAFGLDKISGGAASAVGGHLGDLFNNDQGRMITAVVFGFMSGIVGGLVGPVVGGITLLAGGLLGAVAGPQIIGVFLSAIAFLVIVVAIISALFRVWFQLLLAYINILVDIIFAPFWIVAGLIPGSKINFSSWIRNMAANLAAFPAVLIMFALAHVFLNAFGQTPDASAFVPPLIGNPATANQIGALIALGFVMATPNVVKLMKSVFGAPQGGFGPILGGVLGGVNIINAFSKPILPRLYYRHRNAQTGEVQTVGVIGKRLGTLQKRFFDRTINRVTTGRGTFAKNEGANARRVEPESVTRHDDAPLPKEPGEDTT